MTQSERRIIRYRCYPTVIQEHKLNGLLGACRKVYNSYLEVTKRGSVTLSNEEMKYFRAELHEQNPWLQDYYLDTVIDQVIQQIRGSKISLKGLKSGGYKTGLLRFKKKGEWIHAAFRRSGFNLDTMTGRLLLKKIGWLNLKMDSAPPGQVVQVNVIKEIHQWFVIVCYVIKRKIILVGKIKDVGIDVGLENFVYDSEGNSIKRSNFIKPNLRPLRLINRKLSRRTGPYNQQTKKHQTPSKNWGKAQTRLQRLHQKIRRQRDDFLHKVSSYYSEHFDRVFLERLRIQNMSRNNHLAQSIMDAGWYRFKQLLSYKMEVIEVAPNYTTQNCSSCGNRMKIGLSVRTYVCQHCGHVLPRDHNSAKNILAKGRSDLAQKRSTDAQSGTAGKPATPVEIGVQAQLEGFSRSRKQEKIKHLKDKQEMRVEPREDMFYGRYERPGGYH